MRGVHRNVGAKLGSGTKPDSNDDAPPRAAARDRHYRAFALSAFRRCLRMYAFRSERRARHVQDVQGRQTAGSRLRASIVTPGFPEDVCRHWCRGRIDALQHQRRVGLAMRRITAPRAAL